jgi:hypothetical protein
MSLSGRRIVDAQFGTAEVHDVYSLNDRLSLINGQVFKSLRDPSIRALALDLVRGTPQHGNESELSELSRVFWFVKKNVEYRQDPHQYDLYSTASRTIQVHAGDCDDHCTLIAALVGNLGFIPGAKVISPDGANWHIYALTSVFPRSNPQAPTARYLALDTTQPSSHPGWEPPAKFQRYARVVTFTESGPLVQTVR